MELNELYQEIILDHHRRPRNHGPCEHETHSARAENPSCGDEVEVHLRVSPEGKIEAVTFTGQGCALSQASASLMTTKIRGKPLAEAKATVAQMLSMMKGGTITESEREELGDAQALEGAAKFPQRVKCVTLAWHALEDILGKTEPAR